MADTRQSLNDLSDAREDLEQLIDREGLQNVLEMIGEICVEKSEHLNANWQDNLAAQNWDKAANYVDKCSGFVGKLGV